MTYALIGFGVVFIAALWAFAWRMRKSGEDSMASKVTAKTADVLVRQDQAAAKAPKTKDELVDRLRRGGF